MADDDVLLREGVCSLLERSGFEVVGQAGDATELLEHRADQNAGPRARRHPDAPDHTAEGLEAALVIREEHPDIGILVLSAHVEVDEAMELLATAGASATCSSAG